MQLAQMKPMGALVALGLALAIGCSGQPKGRSLRLPSGNMVTITGVGRMYISGDKSWALVLKYVTQVPLAKQDALKAEVAEVVDLWKPDLNKSGLQLAAVTAIEPPKGFIITTGRGKNFIVKKLPSGAWELK